MNVNTFFDTLRLTGSLDERLRFIKTANFDIVQDGQPDGVIQQFTDIRTLKDAFKVACAFKAVYGDAILCIELSCCYERFMTVMDFLEAEMEEANDPIDHWLLTHAFGKLKFKRAVECDARQLYKVYTDNDTYLDTVSSLKIKYDYGAMKKDNEWLFKEIQQHILHPLRIEKWLNTGNEIEDYMS